MPPPDNGAASKLASAIGPGGSGIKIQLYSGLVNVSEQTTAADLTESAFDGYAPLSRNDWSAPVATDAGLAVTYSKPFAWVAGPDRTKDETVYGWRATLLVGGAEQQLAIQPITPPAPIRRNGQTLELSFALWAACFDPGSNNAILTIEQQVILRGQRIKPSFRARLKGLRKALAGVWASDGEATDRQQRTGEGQYFFFGDPGASASAYDVRVRLDQLLAAPRVVRPDAPLSDRPALVGFTFGG
jgi:hypothetical protein